MTGDHDQRGSCPAYRMLEPVDRLQRETRRAVSRVETDKCEAGAADEQVGGIQRAIETMTTTHPEHPRKLDARSYRAGRIEYVIGVDERRESATVRDVTEAGREQAHSSRRWTPDEFRDPSWFDDF